MKGKFLLIPLSLVLIFSVFLWRSSFKSQKDHTKDLSFISFEESMKKSRPEWTSKTIAKKFQRKDKWKFVRSLYETYIRNPKAHKTVTIPKIIHQIWLGSPFPEKYRRLQKTWIGMHPGWEYRLWADESLKDFPLRNQKLFDTAVNWGEKADILRYEILYRIGGLYVDTDFECFKSFDELHELCDFYAGLFNLERTSMSPTSWKWTDCKHPWASHFKRMR